MKPFPKCDQRNSHWSHKDQCGTKRGNFGSTCSFQVCYLIYYTSRNFSHATCLVSSFYGSPMVNITFSLFLWPWLKMEMKWSEHFTPMDGFTNSQDFALISFHEAAREVSAPCHLAWRLFKHSWGSSDPGVSHLWPEVHSLFGLSFCMCLNPGWAYTRDSRLRKSQNKYSCTSN